MMNRYSLREACNLADSRVDLLNPILDSAHLSGSDSDVAKIALTSGSDILSSLSKCVVTAWGGSTDAFEPCVNGLYNRCICGSREDVNRVEDVQTL